MAFNKGKVQNNNYRKVLMSSAFQIKIPTGVVKKYHQSIILFSRETDGIVIGTNTPPRVSGEKRR